MRKHLITLGLLVAAIAFYAMGLALPATALIVAGIVAEGAFWLRLLRRRKD
jgi:hypothetical protein